MFHGLNRSRSFWCFKSPEGFRPKNPRTGFPSTGFPLGFLPSFPTDGDGEVEVAPEVDATSRGFFTDKVERVPLEMKGFACPWGETQFEIQAALFPARRS